MIPCDDEIIVLRDRIEPIVDQADLDEVYDIGWHLLYDACTRARDAAPVTGIDPASEFLEELSAL